MQTCRGCGKSVDETVYGSCPTCFLPLSQARNGPGVPISGDTSGFRSAAPTRPPKLPPMPGNPPNYGSMPPQRPGPPPPIMPTALYPHANPPRTERDRDADRRTIVVLVLAFVGIVAAVQTRQMWGGGEENSPPNASVSLPAAPAEEPAPPVVTPPIAMPQPDISTGPPSAVPVAPGQANPAGMPGAYPQPFHARPYPWRFQPHGPRFMPPYPGVPSPPPWRQPAYPNFPPSYPRMQPPPSQQDQPQEAQRSQPQSPREYVPPDAQSTPPRDPQESQPITGSPP